MPRCAAFGHEPETAIAHGAFGGREGIRCAVGAAVRRAVTRKITTHPSPAFATLRLVTTASPHSILPQTNSTRNAKSLGLSPKLTAERRATLGRARGVGRGAVHHLSARHPHAVHHLSAPHYLSYLSHGS